MESDEEVMEMVVDHRRNLMMEELSRRQEEDKPLQELKGEVINFNAYTKTKGNA